MSEIDVSKCEYKTIDGCSDTLSGSCVKDNCQTYRLFKQLQQLKVENEELRKSIEILKDTIKIQARTIDKTQSDWFNNFSEMKNKYEQCLDEIEEITKGTCRKRCTNDCLGTKKHCGYGKILQLIKQAKEGDNG